MEDLEINLYARLNHEFGIGLVFMFMPSIMASVYFVAYTLTVSAVPIIYYTYTIIGVVAPFFIMLELMHLNANRLRRLHGVIDFESSPKT